MCQRYFQLAEEPTTDRCAEYQPCQKPLSFCEYIIKQYSNEGDTILDTTTGAGSIPLGCINTNRNFVAFDNGVDDRKQSKNYNRFWADIATERINNHREKN